MREIWKRDSALLTDNMGTPGYSTEAERLVTMGQRVISIPNNERNSKSAEFVCVFARMVNDRNAFEFIAHTVRS